MCTTCGCGEGDVRLTEPGMDTAGVEHGPEHGPEHGHGHGHGHGSDHDHGPTDHVHLEQDDDLRTHTLDLEVAVLAKNDGLAAANRAWLTEARITSLNLMSSPGSGKTTLLERTIAATERTVCVIEGDQETTFDADRIRGAGARVVQVNTGAGCHLDAAMVGQAMSRLAPAAGSWLFIENVGNLVCPALFDLGEQRKVVVISVTEGDDKPLKYPHMFAAADLVLVNKTDLLPYVDFDLERLSDDARKLNPGVEVLALSARTGENVESWLAWLSDLTADGPSLTPPTP